MRQGIKHLVNWDKEGFLIVGEATNGKEALITVSYTHLDVYKRQG